MTRPADSSGFQQVGHSNLNGYGDGMQVIREADALYVGHFGVSGMGTSVLDVRDVNSPTVVKQWKSPPGSHTHKVQVADGLLLVNQEQFRGGDPYSAGMAVYSLDDPLDPLQIGFFASGGRGVHRIWWTGGRYAYVSAIPEGFVGRILVIVDMSDPEHPVEAGRWWTPRDGVFGAPEPATARPIHHALVDGNRAYVGMWDRGMTILDISDVSRPEIVSTLDWSPGGESHTCLPLRGRSLVVTTDEETKNRCEGDPHMARVVDVSDERNPQVISTLPVPEGDFCERGLRFGAHCLHENRPGSYISEEIVFLTYFNAGLRVYDLADPYHPIEIAHWIPETPPDQEDVQINDVFVDEDGLVYATDRVLGGVYILAPDEQLTTRILEATR
jgi:hypothetical protein